jgi:predicted alpha/beta-hydrolase family hydrolase
MSAEERDETRFAVSAPGGETHAILQRAVAPAQALFVYAHGAGGHRAHPTTRALAAALGARGIDVARFDFLSRARGRTAPDRMPVLMETFRAVVAALRERCASPRLLLGGQSMGGRTASLLAAEGFECAGLLLFAYPLHPAGRPESLRDEHLARIGVPVLCCNGTRDDLCRRELMEAVVARLPASFAMHWLLGADHGFHVRKSSGRTDAEVTAEVAERAAQWIGQLDSTAPSSTRGTES